LCPRMSHFAKGCGWSGKRGLKIDWQARHCQASKPLPVRAAALRQATGRKRVLPDKSAQLFFSAANILSKSGESMSIAIVNPM
jgi:hypothetical protein